MTCYRSRDNWHSYAKHSLNEAEQVNMATHLTHCSECRDVVSSIQETAKIFATSRVSFSPPAMIKLNVMEAIDINRYKKVSTPHLFEIKNWGMSMVAAGILLLALNLTSMSLNFQSGQVADFNSQISQQIAHPIEKISRAAFAAMEKLETITLTPHK